MKCITAVSTAIRAARVAAGLTPQGLAQRVYVTQETINQYERGYRNPSPETAQRIEAVLGIDLGVEFPYCQMPGCDRPHHARNWCRPHYAAAKYRGFFKTGRQA